MHPNEVCFIERIWNVFFPREQFHPQDKRLSVISIFYDFFKMEPGCRFLKNLRSDSLLLDVNLLSHALPYPDFIAQLILQPHDIIAYVGYVVRISSCKPMIEAASFRCVKCMADTWMCFEDGIFTPPAICSTDKCRNRYLELQRPSARFSDVQRIKLQELSEQGDEDSARVPRCFEVEARGAMVDLCVPGDIIEVTGVVNALQTDMPRGPRTGGRGMGRESGLHQLYLYANCITGKNCTEDVATSRDEQHQGEGVGVGLSSFPSMETTRNDNEDHQDQDPSYASSSSSSSNNRRVCGDGNVDGNGDGDLTLRRIRSIARCEGCLGLLVASLCPAILGQELVKMGLLLALFGGTARSDTDGPKPRSDVHVLAVGDPGLGKSQLLRAVNAVAPRAVYVCGNTATAAGLTVAISREGRGGEVAIEAGALVLADRGVCCIDELDKLTCDPSALLEAMEQQTVSIAKSGMVTALRSRAAVVAAANPAAGHYNRRKTVCENLKLPEALLSRFDLVFVLLDRADEGRDRLISDHIMRTHHVATEVDTGHTSWSATGAQSQSRTQSQRGEEGLEEDGDTLTQKLRRLVLRFDHAHALVPHGLLREYIAHARSDCHPRMTPQAAKVLQRLYLSMRTRASSGDSIPVTTRHLESLVRLAQARAKMELRDEVTESDASDVLHLLQESLLDASTTDTGQIDVSRKGGLSLSKQVKALAQALSRESELRQSNMFSRQDIEQVAARVGATGAGGLAGLGMGLDGVLDVMRTEGFLLLRGPRLFQLQSGSM